MSKESYGLSFATKDEAHKRADEIGVKGYKDVHHIVPKHIAKRYNLDASKITSQENAIALERDTFHGWIHGKRLTRYDEEVEWKGFDEADYIFLAITLLGFSEEDFNEISRKNATTKRKSKRGKRRRR